MQTQPIDQLILNDHQLCFKDVFGETYDLPNLTTLLNLYLTTSHLEIKKRLFDILNHDLGTLLVVEIMIDATHEVTQKRLETGEISKNMKHVHDYYVIPKSHYALAKSQYEAQATQEHLNFETCHFAFFPYGQVILRQQFPDYKNVYTDTSVLQACLQNA